MMASRGNACPLIIDAKASLLDKELLRPWLSKPQVTNMFRDYFFDAQVRELLMFMAELGIVQFKDDLVWVPAGTTSTLANQTR